MLFDPRPELPTWNSGDPITANDLTALSNAIAGILGQIVPDYFQGRRPRGDATVNPFIETWPGIVVAAGKDEKGNNADDKGASEEKPYTNGQYYVVRATPLESLMPTDPFDVYKETIPGIKNRVTATNLFELGAKPCHIVAEDGSAKVQVFCFPNRGNFQINSGGSSQGNGTASTPFYVFTYQPGWWPNVDLTDDGSGANATNSGAGTPWVDATYKYNVKIPTTSKVLIMGAAPRKQRPHGPLGGAATHGTVMILPGVGGAAGSLVLADTDEQAAVNNEC